MNSTSGFKHPNCDDIITVTRQYQIQQQQGVLAFMAALSAQNCSSNLLGNHEIESL